MTKHKKIKLILKIVSVVLVVAAIFYFFNKYFHGEVGRSEEQGTKGSEVGIEIIESETPIDFQSEENIEEMLEEDIKKLEVKYNEDSGVESLERQGVGAIQEKNDISKERVESFPFLGPIKKKKTSELKIGFMTDIHAQSYFPSPQRALLPAFFNRINHFVEEMHNDFEADLMVANGDVIEGTQIPFRQGTEELRLVKRLFDRTSIPVYWVLGNHDLRSVTKSQWKQALGINYTSKAFEVKDYKIIIADSNFQKSGADAGPGNGFTKGNVSQSEIDWLRKELESSSKKKIVFIHHALTASGKSVLSGASELRSLFAQNDVIAVFSGHIEDLYYEKIDGVKYFVIPGIIKNPSFQGTFAKIRIFENNDLEVDISYIGENGKYRTIQIEE